MQVGDEVPARIDPAVANGKGQQPRQLLADPATIAGVDAFDAAVRKDRDGIRRDRVQAPQQQVGDLVAQVVLNTAGVFVAEEGISCRHTSDLFTQPPARRKLVGCTREQ